MINLVSNKPGRWRMGRRLRSEASCGKHKPMSHCLLLSLRLSASSIMKIHYLTKETTDIPKPCRDLACIAVFLVSSAVPEWDSKQAPIKFLSIHRKQRAQNALSDSLYAPQAHS